MELENNAKRDQHEADWKTFKGFVKSKDPEACSKFAKLIAEKKSSSAVFLAPILKRILEYCYSKTPHSEDWGLKFMGAFLSIPNTLTEDIMMDIMGTVITEIRHFSNYMLIGSINLCLQRMERLHDTLFIKWLEVFSRLVDTLEKRCSLELDGDSVTGLIFKKHIIDSICKMDWNPDNIYTMLTTLGAIKNKTPAEFEAIFQHVIKVLPEVPYCNMPSVTYQLLLVCANSHSEKILDTYASYFAIPYSNSDKGDSAYGSTLGSVVYHFIEVGRFSESLWKGVQKKLKFAQFEPRLFINPFILSLALGLTVVDNYRQKIIEGIRNLVVKSLIEKSQQKHCAWYTNARADPKEDVFELFRTIVEARATDLEFISKGIKCLGIALLDTEKQKKLDFKMKKECQQLGIQLIKEIVLKDKESFFVVMKELLKSPSPAHAACIEMCTKQNMRMIIESQNIGRTLEFMSHIPFVSTNATKPLIRGFIPSVLMSETLLNNIMLMLRKTIWKSVQARKVSVEIIMAMLCQARVTGNIPEMHYSVSQDFFGNRNFGIAERDNEPLCNELMILLKRFFCQSAEVRVHLYLGLENVATKNPEQAILVSKMILSHSKSLMYVSDTGDYKINLTSLIKYTAYSNMMTEMEDLGLYISCMCFLYAHLNELHGFCKSCDEMKEAINQWLIAVKNFEPEELDEALGRAVPNFKDLNNLHQAMQRGKLMLLVQILQAIEAFFELLTVSNEFENKSNAKILFQKYEELQLVYAETNARKLKVKKKNDKNKSKGTKESQNAKKSQDDSSEEGDFKIKRKKGPTVKPPPRVVFHHLYSIEKLKDLLFQIYQNGLDYGYVSALRYEKGSERYALSILEDKLSMFDKDCDGKERKQGIDFKINSLVNVCSILWEYVAESSNRYKSEKTSSQKCIKQDADINAERTRLICECGNFIRKNQPDDLLLFLKAISRETLDRPYDDIFFDFFNKWKAVLKNIFSALKSLEDPIQYDPFTFMLGLLRVLVVPVTPTADCLKHVRSWLQRFMMERPKNLLENTLLVKNFFDVYSFVLSKYKVLPWGIVETARQCHKTLGDAEEESEISSEVDTWLVTVDTAPTVVLSILEFVLNLLDYVNIVVLREKTFHTITNEGVSESTVAHCCEMLEVIVDACTELVQTNFPPGACVNQILVTIPMVFLSLARYTELLWKISSPRRFQNKKFRGLVLKIGKFFKPSSESMINHIEYIQRQRVLEMEKNSKGKISNTVLAQLSKDSKAIPALVYQMERYEEMLVRLSAKTKSNLMAGTKLSTARDFRIKIKGNNIPHNNFIVEASIPASNLTYAYPTSDGIPPLTPIPSSHSAANVPTTMTIQTIPRMNISSVTGKRKKKASEKDLQISKLKRQK